MLPLRSIRGAAAAVLALLVTAQGALAADAKVLGSFKDWNAYAFDEGGHKVCYMSSQPKKKEPADAKRGDIYVMITHRPGEKAFDVVSFIAGYNFKKDAEATVGVGAKSFRLFTEGGTAWTPDADTDKAVVAAMKETKGKPMVMKGTSGRGTKTADTYSLDGVAEAYNAINQACSVKR